MFGLVLPAAIGGFLTGISLLAPSREGLTMLPRSPIKGVILIRWTRFVTRMARHPRNYASPRGRYGMFGMDMRRLSDVGYATNPRKTTKDGEQGIWVGDWKEPLTESVYLSKSPTQYEAFKRSMVAMVPKAEQFIGVMVDGASCSLSGLLGVGHHAGENGIESWVKDPTARERFKATTQTFNHVNGLF
jgi:hypothetical protein